jgi:hypothetical protein
MCVGTKDPSSARSDYDLTGIAGDFDVVVWSSRIKVRALQPYFVTHSSESLIVEDKFGNPALEDYLDSDPDRASNGNL